LAPDRVQCETTRQVVAYTPAMRMQPRSRKSLKDRVYDYILAELDAGRLRPGQRIHEKRICARLHVSRTPVREALLQLEPLRIVAIFPRRGIVVNDLAPEDIRELYETIGPLEAKAGRLATRKLTGRDFERLARSLKKMEALIESGKLRELNRENEAFHRVFVSGCGNQILAQTIHTLKRRFYDVPHPLAYLESWERTLLDEHRHLLHLFESVAADEVGQFLEDVHWNWERHRVYAMESYFPRSIADSEVQTWKSRSGGR
jgi:DNA-binding GntR family transcriptional regulator